MRTRRKKRGHHQRLPGATGSTPGNSQPPRGRMSTPVRHPQLLQPPQYPQPPLSAANENSSRPNLLDQADISRLYKQAHSSLSKDTTARSRQGNFSGSPYWASNKNRYMTGPPREAVSVSQIASIKETDPVQTPHSAALPDIAIDVGLEPPEAAAISRVPREDRLPVIL